MRSMKCPFFVCLIVLSSVFFVQTARAEDDEGAVFVMTNAATNNQIQSFARNENGGLRPAGTFSTGGNGTGGAIDPLHSQGSLRLSENHHLLFAVNAGSGTISSFAVHGTALTLIDTEPSSGSLPTALAQNGDLLYVLNSGGNGNVSGFHVQPDGHLRPVANSSRNLSGTATSPTSLAFTPNGLFLVVTETATNNIDVFHVYRNGELSEAHVNPSAGTVPFAALFAPSGALLVANASNSVSSYELQWDGSLSVISNQVPTLGQATCWDVVTPNGRYLYTANAGTSDVSGFAIADGGSLSPIGNTIVAANPAGSTNLDMATSADGRFLYTLNGATGAIGSFALDRDGTARFIGAWTGLPAQAGLNGIAAY